MRTIREKARQTQFTVVALLSLSGCMVTDYAHQTKSKDEKKADIKECHELTGSQAVINPSDEFKQCMVDKGYMPYEYIP